MSHQTSHASSCISLDGAEKTKEEVKGESDEMIEVPLDGNEDNDADDEENADGHDGNRDRGEESGEGEMDVQLGSGADDEIQPAEDDQNLNDLMEYANDYERKSSGRSDLDRRGAMKKPYGTNSNYSSLENIASDPEQKIALAKWSIRSHPRMDRLTTAILQDDRASLAKYLEDHLSYKIRGLNMPVEIKSRANHIIRSKTMPLGHLLVLFSTPRTLAYLDARKLLVNAIFRIRCDFDVDFASMDSKLGMQRSYEYRDSHKSVPSAFMAAFRDNWPSLKWLYRKGYFRQNAMETDGAGRNLLHIAVEEESPNLIKEILTNRKVFPYDILRNILKARDSVKDETPFSRACARTDPCMMLLFVRSCPPDFVMGREDLSGVGKTIFNYVLSKLTNTTLSTQVVKEFLKRGSVPDHSTFDDTSCIESLIKNEQFAGNELRKMVKLLLKYGAQPTNGALIKLLRLPFRTDEELFQLSKILLKHGGTRLLLSKQAYKLWALHRKDTSAFHPFELASRDGLSVCIDILRNSSITIAKMERLLTLISQYANISAMFPDADGDRKLVPNNQHPAPPLMCLVKLADTESLECVVVHCLSEWIAVGALNICVSASAVKAQLISPPPSSTKKQISFNHMAVAIGERMVLETNDEQYLDLESVLRLILRFALTHSVEEELRVFLNRLQRGILRELFERYDFSRSDHGLDSAMAFISKCLEVMESLEFDFNSLVDGTVGIFSVFHPNVPDEVVMKVLEALPKSFQVNTQDAMLENIGSLVIKRYAENFQTVRKIFELLKSMDFDFTQTVHCGQTLLMLYVSKCGECFDQMQTQDRITCYMETDFFDVIRFLFGEKVDMKYQVTTDDFDKTSTVMNVLSVSMTLTHSNIAEEILKLNPGLLDGVPVETVLAFIKQCPQVLEFLNGRSLMHDDVECTTTEGKNNTHHGKSYLRKNFNEGHTTDIRTTWLQYIHYHHDGMLRFVGEEEQSDFSKQVELIYDYLVHCDFEDEEDTDSAPVTIAMEFSVFRPEIKPSHAVSNNVRHESIKERVNGPLFLKIVEECSPIVVHPLFTEYFEKFYRRAFFNSVAFLLFHMLFLAILSSSLNCVDSKPRPNVNITGHYRCDGVGSQCNLPPIHGRFHILCNEYSGSGNCSYCEIHSEEKSLCDHDLETVYMPCPFRTTSEHRQITIGLYLLLIMGLVGLIRECVQMVLDGMDYLKSYMQNTVEVSMYVFVVLFVINVGDCEWGNGLKESWQYQIGTVAVLNAWFMMFFYMSKFPAFATYVIMFYRSVKSGLWLIITFSSLILGFAFSFHYLLKPDLELYRTIPLSINKVWIMMAGEIDYKATFAEPIQFDFLTRILLFIFVLLISIVLANLFIGLIVGDVEKINKEAELKKWQWNLEFIEYTESMFDFLDKWLQRFRSCCRNTTGIHMLGQLERDRRSTVYLQQVDSGRRRLMVEDSIRHGLYVTDLSWRNMFKWGPLAKFFGFVDRKELIKRLKIVEARKLKWRKQYCALRRNAPQKQQVNQNVVEAPVLRRHLPVVEAPPKKEEEESDNESVVSLNLETDKLKKQNEHLGADMGSTDSLASTGELLPRHEREPPKSGASRHDLSQSGGDAQRSMMEAAARFGFMQFSEPGKSPRFLRVGQTGDLFDGSQQ